MIGQQMGLFLGVTPDIERFTHREIVAAKRKRRVRFMLREVD